MTFNSIEFLIFFPIVALLYFLLPKKIKPILLLAASYFFYMYWNASLVFLILITTLISYFCAIFISKSEKAKTKKLLLVFTLVVCLGILAFFKYFNFLSESIFSLGTLFGLEKDPILLNLILPVGISFYTFQTLSYVIDVYRGDIEVEKNIIWYALYVSFFPQLVAGPIERPENLLPQLKADNKFDKDNLFLGLQKMAIGFFKKIAVADIIASFIDPIFKDVNSFDGLSLLVASVLFTIQVYCDFSGYSEIAMGCAKILGINLMKNFNRPFVSRSMKEFWDRWHISLSSWFKDYIYIPLGGSKRNMLITCRNIMIIFLVSGFWHGASWTFVIWGILHGILRVIGTLTYKKKKALYEKLKINTSSFVFSSLQRIFTFSMVVFCFIFFRANTVMDALNVIGGIFTFSSYSISSFISAFNLNIIAALVLVFIITVLSLLDRLSDNEMMLNKESPSKVSMIMNIVWAVIIAWILILSVGGSSTFIYFQF